MSIPDFLDGLSRYPEPIQPPVAICRKIALGSPLLYSPFSFASVLTKSLVVCLDWTGTTLTGLPGFVGDSWGLVGLAALHRNGISAPTAQALPGCLTADLPSRGIHSLMASRESE